MKTFLKIIFYLAMVVVGFLIGIFTVGLIFGQSVGSIVGKLVDTSTIEMIGVPLLSILAFIVGLGLQVIVHEAGHLVFGLLSGYRFLSFRILNFAFVNENGRIRLKKYSVAGTLGQCLMLAPDVPAEKLPVVAFNLGGIIANLILSALAALMLIFCKGHPIAAVFFMMVALAGVFLILLNGIPRYVSGIPNDGLNATRLRKNPTSRRAFAMLLRSAALVQNGVSPRDLPDDVFLDPDEIDFDEPIQVNNLQTYASALMAQGALERSLELNTQIIDRAPKAKIIVFESKCDAASIHLMRDEADKATAMLSKQEMMQVRAYSKSMSSKMRLLFLLALKADGDNAKAEEIYRQLLSSRDRYLKGEVDMDLDIMERYTTA